MVVFPLVLACGICVAIAAQLPIGILTTIGSVRMDNADVRGTGTVLDGSVIETLDNPAQLTLKNGTRFELSPDSRFKVYDTRFLLEKGASQFHSSGAFPIVVNSLSVTPTSSSTIRVFKASPKAFEVSAVTGQAEVRNASGLLIAKVFPGSALNFNQEPEGAATPFKVSGKLEKSADGHYFLTDVTTKTTFELLGDNLDSSVGNCIAVTGSTDPKTATQIHVTTVFAVSCKKLGLPTAGAAPGASTGLSTGATVAIIGGVAVAGSLGGAAAAGVFSGGSPRTISGQ